MALNVLCKNTNKPATIYVEQSMLDSEAIYLGVRSNDGMSEVWLSREDSAEFQKAVAALAVGKVESKRLVLTYIRSGGNVGKVYCKGVTFSGDSWDAIEPEGWISGGPKDFGRLRITGRALNTFVSLTME